MKSSRNARTSSFCARDPSCSQTPSALQGKFPWHRFAPWRTWTWNTHPLTRSALCGNRLEPQGDLANALSTFKEKAAAAREGRPIDFVKMSPNYDIKTNRLRSQLQEGDFSAAIK